MEDDWNFKSQMIGLENITDVLFLLFVSFWKSVFKSKVEI